MTKTSLPQHVVIMPDGNRRWAKKRGLPGWRGHSMGAKRMEEVALAAIDLNIKYLSIWGGSYYNLTKRPKREVVVLNRIYKQIVKNALDNKTTYEKRVRIRCIGEWTELLNSDVVKLIREAEHKTASHENYYQTYLIGYNGDREMLDALNRFTREGKRHITDNLLKSYLWTADLPSVDFIIRTGGEPHLSTGFMMWHTRDSQLYFTEKLWPDFNKKSFEEALQEYARRERRFGK